MPSTFDTKFARYSAPRLLRDKGESVGYYNAAGDPVRTIDALIERDQIQIIAEVGDVPANAVLVRVLNDSTSGITSAELNTGGDELKFALRIGETAARRSITRLIGDSGGFTRFLCQ